MPKKRDSDDCDIMNELFDCGRKEMIAQIYVKNVEDYTSIVVSNDKGNIYFEEVMEVPELTGIQRGASFVKHQLDSDRTEIYPDKLKTKDIENDVYINYCKINAIIGDNPNEEAKKRCVQNMQIHQRWDLSKINQERGR